MANESKTTPLKRLESVQELVKEAQRLGLYDNPKTTNWTLGVMDAPEVVAENKRINKALAEAVERVKAMPPEKLEAMQKSQAKSWTQQDMD